MSCSKLIIIAFVLRLFLLAVQRAFGMEWDFHVDAAFYVDRIFAMVDGGVAEGLLIAGFENFLYILIGYLIYTLSFGLIEPQYLLISLNVASTLVTIRLICAIHEVKDGVQVPLAAVFVALSPYFMHLSVHPLKDSLVLCLSVALLLVVIRGYWFLAALIGLTLISARFHLGVITVVTLFGWRLFVSINFGRFRQILAMLFAMSIMYVVFNEQLSERLLTEFEGRDFYPDGLSLVPESLPIRFFGGWLLNFLVPFPFFPTRAADAGYFLHLLIFFMLMIFAWWRLKSGGNKIDLNNFGLMLSSLFFFAFVLTTTPGAGPLVRYRLFAEVLLLVSLGRAIKVNSRKISGRSA